MRPNTQQRFLNLIQKNAEKGCWLWLGTKDKAGYGRFLIDGQIKTSHYAAYRLFNGPCQNSHKKHIHHLCFNTSCVNPKHLKLVSAKKNNHLSSVNVKKTHCPKGHIYDAVELKSGKFRSRRCTKCRAIFNKRRKFK